jgi:HEPN domain-containing protein
MATREELKELARLRLREAESLYAARLFDGCVYLCGYVVELALKARICAILGVSDYPDKRAHFKTHDFDELKLLAGMQQEVTVATNPVLFQNWSIATEWKPEWRYQPAGTYQRPDAERVLEAIKVDPNGVLVCISQRW